MLHLHKLKVAGFKSFGDRIEVRFPSGITGIVGPNGCGKSNIGDAINWVLGEQSAKMLRGQNMTDVIFGGSELRKPLGMAEVSLVFRGAESIPQASDGELVLTRRLFRSGESEYRLNGERSRLKDIQEILRGARVGARTYATIEQGKIDQVLNAKPKDRRALIEDAAGISGYKHKRRLAELKLEATHANLLRVNDIVTEVERQINSLKRQAAKARRYRKLREELRASELVRFIHRARAMDEELERLAAQEQEARSSEATAAGKLKSIEASLTEQRRKLEQANVALRQSSGRIHELEIEIDRGRNQIESCEQRIEEAKQRAARQEQEAQALEKRRQELLAAAQHHDEGLGDRREAQRQLNERLQREQARLEQAELSERALRQEIEQLREQQFAAMSHASELRNRRRSAEENRQRVVERRRRIDSERSEARSDQSRTETAVGSLRRELEIHERQLVANRQSLATDEQRLQSLSSSEKQQAQLLAAAREAEHSQRSRLATLEDVDTRFAGMSDGVRSLLGAGEGREVRARGVVADFIEASRDIEYAAEQFLADLLPTVILDDSVDVASAVAWLKRQGAGRTSLISRSQPAGALAAGSSSTAAPASLLGDPRVIGRLKDKLTLGSAMNGVVADRIGDALIVESLQAALELHRRHPGLDYLTRDGEIVFASGVIRAGGDIGVENGLLAHRRRMDEARAAVEQCAGESSRCQAEVDRIRGDLARLEGATREGRKQLEQSERRAVELHHRFEQFMAESERGERRAQILEEELAALADEDRSLEQQLGGLVGETTAAEEAERSLELRLAQQCGELDRQSSRLREQITALSELRAAQAASGERLEAAESEGSRLRESAAEFEARLARLRSEAGAAQALIEQNAAIREKTQLQLSLFATQGEELRTSLESGEQEIARCQLALAESEALQDELRGQVERCRESTREAELARTRSEAERGHLDTLCRRELGIPVAEAHLVDEAPAAAADAVPDLNALEKAIEEIKERIERLGPVNMTAIEEFSELEERFGFLAAQREDLQRSMDALRESIRRINRESRQRFTEAFEAVRQSYQEVYKLLFSGGRADLRLEDEDDVLECGIEILAQPPGKKLAGVHLLSGGEKALSAIALLFAIFRYRPSPFCVLDEVDAALDDSNVGRFIDMVGQFAKHTQFVVVTHNKLSMEAADLLYGVTMQEPGVSKVVSLELGPATEHAQPSWKAHKPRRRPAEATVPAGV